MTEGLLSAEDTVVDELSGSIWVVIIYNDDITPWNFVHKVLMKIFGKSSEEALALIDTAESEGSAPVKYYTDPSLAEVAIAMVEGIKKKEGQPNFRLKMFEILN